MIETLEALVSSPIVDLLLKIVGVAGFIVGALALRAARASVQAAKDSDISNLKLRATESLAAAERSFFTLQTKCRSVDASWKEHIAKHHAPLTSHRNRPAEILRNAQVERDGIRLLRELTEPTTKLDEVQLEQRIREAQRVALEIERLSFRLEEPPILRR